MDKHIIIIGGGPAGYEAALYGAASGAQVTLIEQHKIGGTCLNYGCIPTKTLVENASMYKKILESDLMGISIEGVVSLDSKAIDTRKAEVISKLQKGILSKLKKSKVNYVEGIGTIVDKGTVQVTYEDSNTATVSGDIIILATGSKPSIPTFVDQTGSSSILTSKDLLQMMTYPEKIVIVGGGVIGMEFACILNDFGTDVTVLEYAPNLLPSVDSAVGKRLKSILTKDGITIETGAKVSVVVEDHIVYENKKGGQTLESECTLIAVGRQGLYDEVMCDRMSIDHNGRFITVDDCFQTTSEGIYAIGDVNGLSLLAHSAYDQARQLIDYLEDGRIPIKKSVPACVFTTPEIGTVGVSESEAKDKGIDYRTEKTLYSSSGKALAMKESTGFIKSIVDNNDKLIGLHIMGVHASDLIHYGSMAIASGMTVNEMKKIIFAHPTIGELFSDNLYQY